MRKEGVGLEHHGDVPLGGREMGDIPPSDGDRPRIDLLEPGDEPQGRGLAASEDRGGQGASRPRPEADPVDASTPPQDFDTALTTISDMSVELMAGYQVPRPEQHFRKLDEAVSRMARATKAGLCLSRCAKA